MASRPCLSDRALRAFVGVLGVIRGTCEEGYELMIKVNKQSHRIITVIAD